MKSFFGGSSRGHLDVDLLSAFLDRQTTQDERVRIETHLQTCAQCRAELESLRRTVALLHILPRVALPRAFTLSEAQVGIRHPATTPGWFGGLVRGLGAVAALALVAFLAVSLLQQPAWTPGATLARAPTLAPSQAPAATQSLPAAQAPSAPSQAAGSAAAASPEASSQDATAAPEVEQPAESPAAAMAQAEQAPTPEPAPSPADTLAAAPAPEAQETGRSAASAATPTEPAVAAMAAKAADTPVEGATEMGRGGGGPAIAVVPPEALTPEPTAPAVPLAEALPAGARLVYADQRALYAVDRDQQVRELVVADGINTPQLSPDQQWIAYRTYGDQSLKVWGIPWKGGEPRLLLDDGNLPKDNLPEGFAERHFNESRWAPGGHILAIVLVANSAPDAAEFRQVLELWHLNVDTGQFWFVTTLDRAFRPFYSSDGERFATLQYGTETDPQGAVTIYRIRNGERPADGKKVLEFEAGPGKPLFDGQIAWTPDKRLLIAIPDADPQFQNPIQLNGITLYRANDFGEAKPIGTVDGFQVAWSPKADRMVISRYTSDTMENVELYIANADGSSPELYATTKSGSFMGWSPDGTSFLYSDNYQIYTGAPGQEPRRLANGVSLWDPRWVNDRQFISLHDQGERGWWLTLRDVDGAAAGLLPLPRETTMDLLSAAATR